MDDEELDDKIATAAPQTKTKKRSIFDKKSWAKPTEVKKAESEGMFSRAKELLPQRLAEQERERQRKAKNIERKRSSSGAGLEEDTPPEEKKRCIQLNKKAVFSDSDENNRATATTRRVSTNASTPPSRVSRSSGSGGKQDSPTSLSSSHIRIMKAQNPEASTSKAVQSIITLTDSSDSEDERYVAPLASRNAAPLPINLAEDDYHIPALPRPQALEEDLAMFDEELPHLVEAARERARKREEERENAAKALARRKANDDDIFNDGIAGLKDPPIEILITSQMEGTKPLRVKRRLSHTLKEAKHAWCDIQSFDGQPTDLEFKDSIFLMWNDKKLYDSNTCSLLGFKFDSRGRLMSSNGVDSEGRIHLEAWTVDAYEAYQKRREAKARRANGDAGGDASEGEGPVKKTKIVLKTKDLTSKYTVQGTTPIAKLIKAFRVEHKIPDGKAITLLFDGDELDLESKIEDTELEDMDTVEVHVQ